MAIGYEDNDDDSVDPSLDYDATPAKGHPPAHASKELRSHKENAADAGVKRFLETYSKQILPALMTVERTVERAVRMATPFVTQGIQMYEEAIKVLEPYGIKEIAQCLTGFLMMFFGGFFITTVAVYEAIVQGGLENFKLNLKLVYGEFARFRAANELDDKEDLDNDGIADVLEISPEKYVVRKALVALRAVDPDTVAQSMHNLYTIFIAVVATLRLQFARTISLGASIGDQIDQVYDKVVAPQLEKMIDSAYHKWIQPVGMYVNRFIGVCIAFQIQRILSTVHTAMKGARVFTKGLTDLSIRNGYGYLTEGYLDEALSGVLAVLGVYMQLFAWSQMPVIVKLAFFPAFFVESVLSLAVSVTMTVTGDTAQAGGSVATATSGWW